MMRRMVAGLVVLVVLCGAPSAGAQPYADGEENRFRFAQLNLGLELAYLPGTTETYVPAEGGDFDRRSLRRRLLPRLVVGGYHFWGHADFYVAFPVASLPLGGSGARVDASLSPGIETGARVYPWPLRHGAIRPFVGASWAVGDFEHKSTAGTGPTLERHHMPLQVGLARAGEFGNLELGLEWSPLLEFDYPVAPGTTRRVGGDVWWVWLGYKYAVDTTLGGEQSVADGTVDELRRAQKRRGVRSDLSVGIGASSAFTARDSSLPDDSSSLPPRPNGTILPDVALGYYVAPFDAGLRLNYRTMTQKQSGYGVSRRYRRHSLSLDAFKMLADYHGFVPFVGPGISGEWLSFRETGGADGPRTGRSFETAFSLLFGWDIRPVRTSGFVIRTNLRYTPFLNLELDGGGRAAFEQFEFNFLQLVVYPRRLAFNLRR